MAAGSTFTRAKIGEVANISLDDLADLDVDGPALGHAPAAVLSLGSKRSSALARG